MKLPMLLICMVCVTNVMAERPTLRGPAVPTADGAAAGSAHTPGKICEPTQSFEPLQAREFKDIVDYDKTMSFSSDRRQEWLSGMDGAFSCIGHEPGMRWQAPGGPALEAMRLLPSYPSSSNPSVPSSGWRKLKAE